MWYKLTWIYIKKYWWTIALVVATIVLVMLGKSTDLVDEIFEKKREQTKKEIDAIKDNQDKLLELQQQNLDNYHVALKEVNNKYNIKEEEITASTKKKIKKFLLFVYFYIFIVPFFLSVCFSF
jgi:flagellar basal body-associated protein FliL